MFFSDHFFVIFLSVLFVQRALAQQEICSASGNSTIEYCRLREEKLDTRLWNYFAGNFCYFYTNGARLKKRFYISSQIFKCDGKNVAVPIAVVNNLLNITFNYKNSSELKYIRESFKNDAVFNNYLTCCSEAEDCCNRAMNNENINDNSTHCSAVWDGWTCFPPTKVNTSAKLVCSSQAYQSPEDVCTLESEKKCIWNRKTQEAEWIQKTDYSLCAIAPVYAKRYNFHIIFLGVCIGFCVPAIVIFLIFEKLRKTVRVILHRNLLTAICIRNVFTILSKKLVILDQLKSPLESHHVMEKNGVCCRILAFLEMSSVNSIYACMFLDAYYLHKVIVRAFAKETRLTYIYIVLFGDYLAGLLFKVICIYIEVIINYLSYTWKFKKKLAPSSDEVYKIRKPFNLILLAMTFTFSFCWAVAMAAKHAENCWMVDAHNLQWILDGFRIFVLVVNTILLADIIRVMVLKLKHGSTTKQTKAAFKATLFLVPLFGLHILVTAKKIVLDSSCAAEDSYNYARYSMEGLQGIVVSIIFCYFNNEVRNEVKNGYRKTCIFLNQKFGWNLGRDLLYNPRRATTATYVQEEKTNHH